MYVDIIKHSENVIECSQIICLYLSSFPKITNIVIGLLFVLLQFKYIYLVNQPKIPQTQLKIHLLHAFVLVMEVDDIEPKVPLSYYVLKFTNMHIQMYVHVLSQVIYNLKYPCRSEHILLPLIKFLW